LFHVFLIARNLTTIEFCEKLRDRHEDSHCTEGNLPVNYDMGLFRNFQSVLGSNPLTWWLPVGGPPGDGITFLTDCHEPLLSSTAGVSTNEEQPSKVFSDNDACADPEATHPVACGATTASDEKVRTKRKHHKKGSGNGLEIAEGGEEEEEEENDGDGEENDEEGGSEAATSRSVPSEGDKEGFLVWRDSAEFVEDLTIGCQFIAEKTEDCGRSSLHLLLTSCVPSAWGRKALPSTRVFPKRSRARLPAVRIVPVRSSDAGCSSGHGENDSCSSEGADGEE